MTKVYRAVYDFEKTDEEELSISTGDNLLAIGDDEGGWLEVQNLETGLKGYVPTEYLELDESASNESKTTVPTAAESNQSPPIIQAPPVLAPPVPAIPIPDINITNNNISNNNNISKEDQTTNASSKENRRSYKLTRPKISLSRFRRGMKSLNDGPYSQNTKIKGGTMKLKDFVNQSAQYNSGRQGNHSSILIPGIPFIGKESTINSQTNQQINDIQSEEKNCNESSNANMTNMNSNTLGSEGQVFDIESRP